MPWVDAETICNQSMQREIEYEARKTGYLKEGKAVEVNEEDDFYVGGTMVCGCGCGQKFTRTASNMKYATEECRDLKVKKITHVRFLKLYKRGLSFIEIAEQMGYASELSVKRMVGKMKSRGLL